MVTMGAHLFMQTTLTALELNTSNKKFIGNKTIITTIYKIQAYDVWILLYWIY